MAHSMEEAILIDPSPTDNSDEQGEPAAPVQDEIRLSRWGRGRVILKNYYPYGDTEEEQNEGDKIGSCSIPEFNSDQAECSTSVIGSSGATDNPYNAGYDQSNRYGMFPKSSRQKIDKEGPALPLYGVVTNQPYGPTTVAMGPTPPDYLLASVLACLCCFWPTGLCAIYYACRRDTLMAEGNILEANRMSTDARNLTIISVVLGVFWIALVIVLRVVVFTSGGQL